MPAFLYKVLALVAMFFDHAAAVFPDYFPLWYRIIGRLTFPIFVYLLAEGFRYTRDHWKYLFRLFAFAIISQPFYSVTLGRNPEILRGYYPWYLDFVNSMSFSDRTNIFYTLFLGAVGIVVAKLAIGTSDKWYNPLQKKSWEIWLTIALSTMGLMWLASYLGTDFGHRGVLFVVLMYVVKPKWLRLLVMAVMCVWLHEVTIRFYLDDIRIPVEFYWMILSTLLTVPLMAFYNGKRGPSLKWLFYAAYPVHLAVLAVAAWIIL